MTRADLRQFIDDAIQDYDIPADLYDSVLDAATIRAWPVVDSEDDMHALDMDELLEGLY